MSDVGFISGRFQCVWLIKIIDLMILKALLFMTIYMQSVSQSTFNKIIVRFRVICNLVVYYIGIYIKFPALVLLLL